MTASSRSPTRAPASASASRRKPPNLNPAADEVGRHRPAAPATSAEARPSAPSSKLTVLWWNVSSIRRLLEQGPDDADEVAASEDADVVLLQETKLQEKHVPEMDARVLAKSPCRTWNCSMAAGVPGG